MSTSKVINIEFVKHFFRDGSSVLVLRCPHLDAAPRCISDNYFFFISTREEHPDWDTTDSEGNVKFVMKSRASGRGSIRYYSAATLEEAMAHGRRWARRKIFEVQKAARADAERREALIFGRNPSHDRQNFSKWEKQFEKRFFSGLKNLK